MKSSYLSVLGTSALLSFSLLTSCSNSAVKDTTASRNVGTEVGTTSETAKTQTNSTVTEVKSSNSSVGNPLAAELQGKPVVVDVFATWCAGCKNIAPTLSELKKEYAGKVNFVVLDVTDKAKTQATESQAVKLGLSNFLKENKSKTSTVAIVDPANGNILAIFKNNANKEDYTKILDSNLPKS